FQAPGDGGAEFVATLRKGGDAAIAGGEVARRQVEQHLLEIVPRQPPRDFVRRMVVGKQILYRREAGIGGCGKAVQERPFLEQPGEIGGKIEHQRFPVMSITRPAARIMTAPSAVVRLMA